MAPKTLKKANFELETIPDVKQMLREVINASLRGDLDISWAKAAMYGASIAITCIRDHDLEKRMEKLEKLIESKG